jgi:hypothetical protein
VPDALHTAAANFAAIEPTIQQAIGLMLLSTTVAGLAAGLAIGGIWMGWARR